MSPKTIGALLPASPGSLSGMGHAVYTALQSMGLQIALIDPFAAQEARLRWKYAPYLLMGKARYRRAKRRERSSWLGLIQRNRFLEALWQTLPCRGDLTALLQVSTLCGPVKGMAGPYLLLIDHTSKMSERMGLSWHHARGDPEKWHELQLAIYQAVDFVFVPSENVRQSVVEDYGVAPAKAFTVGHGCTRRTLAEPNQDRPIDVAIAVTDPGRQRLSLFLEAANRLLHAADLRVLVIGARVSNPRIRWLPKQPRPAVHRLLEQTKIYVMPALMGGHQSVLEALASGCAVVITTGNPSLWALERDDRSGCVPVRADASELAAVLYELLHDPALRDRLACFGMDLVERQHSWEAILRKMFALAGVPVGGT